MNLISLMMFGSCARGDNNPDSDIDLLAVHSDDYYKMNSFNKLNIVYYSNKLLKERMIKGNLFSLHLCKEGKIIYDKNNSLKKIIDSFKYKTNYSDEIQEASDLGWVLTKFAKKFDNYFFFNKKLAWCIRTILIAKSAEKHTPVFSKNDLVHFTNDDNVAIIVNSRTNEKYIGENIKIMKSLLERHGNPKPEWLNDIKIINDTKSYFSDSTYAYLVVSKFKEIGYSK